MYAPFWLLSLSTSFRRRTSRRSSLCLAPVRLAMPLRRWFPPERRANSGFDAPIGQRSSHLVARIEGSSVIEVMPDCGQPSVCNSRDGVRHRNHPRWRFICAGFRPRGWICCVIRPSLDIHLGQIVMIASPAVEDGRARPKHRLHIEHHVGRRLQRLGSSTMFATQE